MSNNKDDGILNSILGFILTVVVGYYIVIFAGFAIADFFGWSITIMPAIRFLIPDSIIIVERLMVDVPLYFYDPFKDAIFMYIEYEKTN